MLIYKGFIKVSNNGTFYPISRIKSLSPAFGNSLETAINFDDGNFITVDKTMMQTIDILKDGNNDR